jgi:sedoheptulokinase
MSETFISVGLDIGTTSIGAAALECGGASGIRVLKTVSVPNPGAIPAPPDRPWERMQSTERIWETAAALLDSLLEEYRVSAIGVTGQMHGILYASPDGRALSPLYTWQDGRAGVRHGEDAQSACEAIRRLTGYAVPEGYGLATHVDLMRHGQTPAERYCLCTVMDWTVMRLTGLSRPMIHVTNAASLGLYRSAERDFDPEALCALGIDGDTLPFVTAEPLVLGEYRGIPVTAAIGDNQAAFNGTLWPDGGDPAGNALLNVGTGSQISVLSDVPARDASGLIESRPFDGKRYLLSGSGLCGGRAYALLESFFRRYAAACGLPSPDGRRYDVLNALAEEGRRRGSVLSVRTTFCGTRADPSLRGEITGIGENDLTPEALAAGVLYGIADELYGMYRLMDAGHVRSLAASGNAVRKNPVLREILSEKFGMPVTVPGNTEEAACGAAIFAAGKA